MANKILLSQMWKKSSKISQSKFLKKTNFPWTWFTNPSLGTMLQKLSKCEVKAWLCWNLIISQPLQFYVKSSFGEFRRSKNVIFDNFRGSEFWFLVNLSNFQVPNLPNSKFRVSKIAKNNIFGLFEFAKTWFHVKSEWQ